MKNSNDIESIFDEVIMPTINRCGIKKENENFTEDDSQIGGRVYAVQVQGIFRGLSIGLRQIVYRIVQNDIHVTMTELDYEEINSYAEEYSLAQPSREDLILYYKTINESDIFSHLNWLVYHYENFDQLLENENSLVPDFTPSYFKKQFPYQL